MPGMISLNGFFKVDIFDQSDSLVSGTDYFNNFITPTGLSYPFDMPYADCFKYLSIGKGTAANTMHTTGLETPHKHEYTYMTGYVEEGCKTIFTTSGCELYRAWRVPEIPKTYFKEDIEIEELMTSPHSGTSSATSLGGKGAVAFSRVLKSLEIPSGDFAVVTYKLNFVVDTTIRNFAPFVGLHTPSYGGGADGPPIWQALTGQSRLLHQGIQFVKGSAVTNEEGENMGGEGEGDDAKVGDSYASALGEPLEPYYTGFMGTDPDTNEKSWSAYFSTDDTQFMVEPWYGGKIKTGWFHPWTTTHNSANTQGAPILQGMNMASGFPEFYWDLLDQRASAKLGSAGGNDPGEEGEGGNEGGEEGTEDTTPKTLTEYRTHKDRAGKWKKFRVPGASIPDPEPGPSGTIFKEITSTGMGQGGYTNKNIVISENHDMFKTDGAYEFPSRTRHITRTASWQGINAKQDPAVPGTFIRYKSLVFRHKEYAFMDSLFGTFDVVNYPDDGTFQPRVHNYANWETPAAGGLTSHPDGHWTGTEGAFPYQDAQNGLSVTWKLEWSAPCAGVPGCTEP